jgi:hypothetical protein
MWKKNGQHLDEGEYSDQRIDNFDNCCNPDFCNHCGATNYLGPMKEDHCGCFCHHRVSERTCYHSGHGGTCDGQCYICTKHSRSLWDCKPTCFPIWYQMQHRLGDYTNFKCSCNYKGFRDCHCITRNRPEPYRAPREEIMPLLRPIKKPKLNVTKQPKDTKH